MDGLYKKLMTSECVGLQTTLFETQLNPIVEIIAG